MGQTIVGGTRGAGGEAAAGGGAHAVRLAGDGPGSADESGRGGSRAQAHCQNREDAGARGCRMALAARQHSDSNLARSPRPSADRDGDLFLRAHQ
jgi:hypothetical protein